MPCPAAAVQRKSLPDKAVRVPETSFQTTSALTLWFTGRDFLLPHSGGRTNDLILNFSQKSGILK